MRPDQADQGAFARRSDDDFAVEWYSGSGAGGQHRNKHQNSARITHLPTGIVRTAQTRSRENSYQSAMAAIIRALDAGSNEAAAVAENSARQKQVGSGERSDKRRTVRFQHDEVVDHLTGRRTTARDYMRGGMDKLWN